jgi:vacuolar-type H+-ATPase subunit E/Vma4
MNEPQEAQSTAREQAAHEPCPCREIVDTVREYLGISPAARQHLANSRVEFLKALREMLDARIEHLSSQPQKGTKVAVE